MSEEPVVCCCCRPVGNSSQLASQQQQQPKNASLGNERRRRRCRATFLLASQMLNELHYFFAINDSNAAAYAAAVAQSRVRHWTCVLTAIAKASSRKEMWGDWLNELKLVVSRQFWPASLPSVAYTDTMIIHSDYISSAVCLWPPGAAAVRPSVSSEPTSADMTLQPRLMRIDGTRIFLLPLPFGSNAAAVCCWRAGLLDATAAAAPSPILLLLALLQSSPPLGLLLLLVFDSGGRNACTFLE